jgi:lipid A 4'-phosphatase
MKRYVLLDWLIPLVILAGLTVLFRVTDLDLTVQGLLYDRSHGWMYTGRQPWRFLYDFGVTPACVIGWVSLAILIGSFWIGRIAPYRKIALFLVLVVLVGPGLIVNVVFKDHWGRPRPRDIEAFSGTEPYLRVWEKGFTGKGGSFPCGHCSMGFYLCSGFFIYRRRSRKWALFFLALGLCYGSLIGIARMIQGAHFTSDVIWSGGFVYLCGLGFSYLLRLNDFWKSRDILPSEAPPQTDEV